MGRCKGRGRIRQNRQHSPPRPSSPTPARAPRASCNKSGWRTGPGRGGGEVRPPLPARAPHRAPSRWDCSARLPVPRPGRGLGEGARSSGSLPTLGSGQSLPGAQYLLALQPPRLRGQSRKRPHSPGRAGLGQRPPHGYPDPWSPRRCDPAEERRAPGPGHLGGIPGGSSDPALGIRGGGAGRRGDPGAAGPGRSEKGPRRFNLPHCPRALPTLLMKFGAPGSLKFGKRGPGVAKGTLLVTFGREWVRGEEELLLWGSLSAAFLLCASNARN